MTFSRVADQMPDGFYLQMTKRFYAMWYFHRKLDPDLILFTLLTRNWLSGIKFQVLQRFLVQEEMKIMVRLNSDRSMWTPMSLTPFFVIPCLPVFEQRTAFKSSSPLVKLVIDRLILTGWGNSSQIWSKFIAGGFSGYLRLRWWRLDA